MISITNTSFQYHKEKPLFDDLSLELKQGQIVGLLGRNGAGKSTLIKLIAGLVAPKSGDIDVNGYRPFERNPNYLEKIYRLPEELSLPAVTIKEYTQSIAPLYPDFDQEKLDRIGSEFGLNGNDRLNQLSHGQRKKFLITFALATNCRILLLDEPTNGLDIPSKSLFRKLLLANTDNEQIVIIATHQVKDIDLIVDRLVVIDSNQIIFHQSLEEIARQYLFEIVPGNILPEDTIYSERAPMGHFVIRPNQGEFETTVDSALLFSAIINQHIKQH